jgi:hypothetical protein
LRIKRYLFIVLVTILYGCQNQNVTIAPTEVKQLATETPTPPYVVATSSKVPEKWTLWSESAHASTGGTASVANTYCAECHSPLNWNPQATRDTAVPVLAGEWMNIPCEVCHEASGTGSLLASISWWDPTTDQNQPVADSTELCEKCHRDTVDFHYKVNLDDSVHSGFGCMTCHEPHSTAASCTNSGCHDQIRPESSLPPGTPTGGVHPNNTAFCGGANCHPAATQAALSNTSIHSAMHASVSCIACHDSSGLDVAPFFDLGTWMPFQILEKDGVPTKVPVRSHAIHRTVDCTRCHFEGNGWGLPLVTGAEFGP